MVKEAEKYAEEDKKNREEAELLNQANTLVYSTEKALKDYGDKVSASDKEATEKELTALKEAIKDKKMDSIKSGIETLQKASHKLAEEAYKATAAQPQGQAGPEAAQGGPQAEEPTSDQGGTSGAEQGKKDDIIDADFKASNDK